MSHNHKKRTRGALTASLFVVPPGSLSPRGFLFAIPTYLVLLRLMFPVLFTANNSQSANNPQCGPGPSTAALFTLATTEPVGICPATQPTGARFRHCRALPRSRPPGAVTF